MNGDPCQPLADNLNQLEADAQSLRDTLKDASSPEKQDLLKQIKTADQQIMSARLAFEACRRTHPAPSGPESVTSTFTGSGTINVASGSLPDPLTEPTVSFTLLFEGSAVRMLTFDTLTITEPHQITVTMAGWQWGTFDPNTGAMTVPVTFLFDLGFFGQYTLVFAPPLMTTEQQAPPVDMRYSPMGARLDFQSGSVALAGAGYFTDTDGNQSDAAQLVFSGKLSPLPVTQPRRRQPFEVEEIGGTTR